MNACLPSIKEAHPVFVNTIDDLEKILDEAEIAAKSSPIYYKHEEVFTEVRRSLGAIA